MPDGYLLPEGVTMADVHQLDRELLASEGLEVEGLQAGTTPRMIAQQSSSTGASDLAGARSTTTTTISNYEGG